MYSQPGDPAGAPLMRAPTQRTNLNPAAKLVLLQQADYCCANPFRRCPLPGCRIPFDDNGHPFGFELDHIRPFANGGLGTLDNYQVLCCVCHNLKTKQDRVQRGPVGGAVPP